MSDSNNKQRGGLISSAFGVAKKLSETGLDMINHVAPGSVNKLVQNPKDAKVIQGSAKEKTAFEPKKYENPQQMMREHLPNVTGKLLGKHYKKINNVASFISPDLNDKLSDYLFDKLNDFVSEWSSVEALLKEVGAKSLSELAKDPARSQRISMAIANQNKIIAAIQGTLTGAIGGVGAIIDVPTSLALALRSIYQTGRAHGFELNIQDQDVVEYIFKQIDLGSIAEKQALMAAIRTFTGVMETHNVNQLQQLLGSGNDIELLKKWVANDDGSFKLNWMNNLPQLGLLSKLTPLATMGISAVYSWKLVEDATDQAEVVFSGAQNYLLQHSNVQMSVLEAYEKSVQLISQASPRLLNDIQAEQSRELTQKTNSKSVQPVVENEAVSQVEVKAKTAEDEQKPKTEQDIQQGIQTLVDKHVEGKVEVKPAQSKPRRTAQKKTVATTTQAKVENSAAAKTVTKKRAPAKTKVATQATEKAIDEAVDKSANKAD
ncbi:MAG: EcsC family protein [Acinetobacter sp.]